MVSAVGGLSAGTGTGGSPRGTAMVIVSPTGIDEIGASGSTPHEIRTVEQTAKSAKTAIQKRFLDISIPGAKTAKERLLQVLPSQNRGCPPALSTQRELNSKTTAFRGAKVLLVCVTIHDDADRLSHHLQVDHPMLQVVLPDIRAAVAIGHLGPGNGRVANFRPCSSTRPSRRTRSSCSPRYLAAAGVNRTKSLLGAAPMWSPSSGVQPVTQGIDTGGECAARDSRSLYRGIERVPRGRLPGS